jgi:Family of unknown function (DUF6416)
VADKQIIVEVPEERVAEFYAWFAEFLSAPAGGFGPSRRRRGGPGRHRGARGPGGAPGTRGFGGPSGFGGEPGPWTDDDIGEARWIYRKLSDPARELLDLLIDNPGERFSGNDIASRLTLEKGAHGVAGVLAWPGRWCRKLGREFPVDTEAREDGGTDFSMSNETAALFDRARRPD